MNIGIVGHVCIDRNVTEHTSYVGAGGPAMFMDTVFQELPHCRVRVIAPYGEDFLPFKNGTNVYPEPQRISTLVYENIVRNGIRTQRCFHYLDAKPVPVGDQLHDIDVVCFAPLTPYFPAEYIQNIKSTVKKATPVFLLPQGYFRQFDENNSVMVRDFIEEADILPLVDYVIVSDQDYQDMEVLAMRWAKSYGATVVVTQAERGAVVFEKTKTYHVSTEPVLPEDIVSSVGAGDVFSAGFMYQILHKTSVLEAVKYGNMIAGRHLRVVRSAG